MTKAEATRSESEKLVGALTTASDDGSRVDALDSLRVAAEESYGADAAALAAAVRDGGGIECVVSCVASSDSETQQCALSLLGNLLTDVFDRAARESLAKFVACGGLPPLQAALGAGYPTSVFACAVLQNMTSLDPFDTCAKLREQGCARALGALVGSDDETVSSYATAVLANLRAYDPEPEADDAVDEAIRQRRLAAVVEQMRTRKAVATVQGAAVRWVRRRRAMLVAS